MQAEDRWDQAGEMLAEAGRGLQSAGGDLLLICTNTMHAVADQVVGAVSVPLLHLADTTADAVLGHRLRRIGLLGTAFTMERAFYKDRLARQGLDVLVPDGAGREMVYRVIYDELCRGVVRHESRAEYQHVIDTLVAAGAEGVILGCIEIELLVRPEHSPVPVFPTTRLHAEAAVDFALA